MIITSIKSRLKKSTHNYDIEVPTSVEHIRAIDKKNVNNLWMEALKIKMANFSITFEILDDDQPLPVGYIRQLIQWDLTLLELS